MAKPKPPAPPKRKRTKQPEVKIPKICTFPPQMTKPDPIYVIQNEDHEDQPVTMEEKNLARFVRILSSIAEKESARLSKNEELRISKNFNLLRFDIIFDYILCFIFTYMQCL